MPATLCIQVFAEAEAKSQTIDFFESDDWTLDSERELISRLQEVLGLVRSVGRSFKISIDMDVTNFNEAVFLIRKQTSRKVEINNQKLSIREIEVLGLIMQGFTNNEIAARLFISYETVKSHRKNILEKTKAKNTAALINHYHQTFFEK